MIVRTPRSICGGVNTLDEPEAQLHWRHLLKARSGRPSVWTMTICLRMHAYTRTGSFRAAVRGSRSGDVEG
eukprot:36714-Eustigmatos_ZCMA.PRE.1